MERKKRLTLGQKVRLDAVRQNAFKKSEQKEHFAKHYDKIKKVYEFPEPNKINMNKHFYFPKLNETFLLDNNSLAIYPCLCSKANFENNDWFHISEQELAFMSGISVPSVIKGVSMFERYIIDGENFLQRKMVTKENRTFYLYKVGFIRKSMIKEWKNNFFIFHSCIIESSAWSNLTPRAKKLYVAMRSAAKFDVSLYTDIEYPEMDFGHSEDTMEFFSYIKQDYKDRKWDVCTDSLAKLCKRVGISAINLNPILMQLEEEYLIERVDKYFKVYLKPHNLLENGRI